MSGAFQAWYSAPELDALAARGAVLGETLELERLTRLAELVSSADGAIVEAELELAPGRRGWTPAELRFTARLQMTCQRCLEALELKLSESVELGLVESEAMESCLPEGRVAYVLESGRMSPAQVLEDELLVSLPLVPRHEDTAECGSLARDAARLEAAAGAGR